MKTPPDNIASACMEARKRSKRGYSTIEDMEFCRSVLKEYPEWYHSTEHIVFNETVPYGSRVRMEPLKPLPPKKKRRTRG